MLRDGAVCVGFYAHDGLYFVSTRSVPGLLLRRPKLSKVSLGITAAVLNAYRRAGRRMADSASPACKLSRSPLIFSWMLILVFLAVEFRRATACARFPSSSRWRWSSLVTAAAFRSDGASSLQPVFSKRCGCMSPSVCWEPWGLLPSPSSRGDVSHSGWTSPSQSASTSSTRNCPPWTISTISNQQSIVMGSLS